MKVLAMSSSCPHCRRFINSNKIWKNGLIPRTKRHDQNLLLFYCELHGKYYSN